MNDRRRFLQVIGSGAMAVGVTGAGCSAAVKSGSEGVGGSGAGGSGAGGMTGAGGATGSTTSTTSSGAVCEMNPVGEQVGKPTAYATNGLHIVTNKSVLIGRDAGGLYALTAVCTHAGCDMAAVDSQGPFGQLSGGDIICLCHGSAFGPTGSVVQGPAHQSLRAFALALGCDGNLYVNTKQTVATTVRLNA
jgi:Rieske Fe-S protein